MSENVGTVFATLPFPFLVQMSRNLMSTFSRSKFLFFHVQVLFLLRSRTLTTFETKFSTSVTCRR